MLFRLICTVSFILVLSTNGTVSAKDEFSVDRELAYCRAQVKKALKELRPYNFNMQPRNILHGDKQKGWNLRQAKAEEWCSGFWPGILWMTYSIDKDPEILKAAKGYTQSLHDLAYRPAYPTTFSSICKGGGRLRLG